MRHRCEEAQQLHEDLVAETGCSQSGACDFPFEDCLTGFAKVSYATAITDSYDPTIEYTVSASCSATSSEPRNPDGSWAFLNEPTNQLWDDPSLCGAPENYKLDPLGTVGTHSGVDDSGMQATLTWDFDGTPGADSTDTVAAQLGYSVRPCGKDMCVQLSSLSASVENLKIAGVEAQSARITIVGTTTNPTLTRGESFTYPTGSLQAMVDVQTSLGVRTLYSTNSAPAYGRHNPAGDVFQLSNLQFTHADRFLTGTLSVDVSARYENQPPSAAIRLLAKPKLCGAVTSFHAASSEPDQDSMTHVWWAPGQGTGSGPVFDVPLPHGSHPIMLISSDSQGRRDVEVLIHRNSCK